MCVERGGGGGWVAVCLPTYMKQKNENKSQSLQAGHKISREMKRRGGGVWMCAPPPPPKYWPLHTELVIYHKGENTWRWGRSGGKLNTALDLCRWRSKQNGAWAWCVDVGGGGGVTVTTKRESRFLGTRDGLEWVGGGGVVGPTMWLGVCIRLLQTCRVSRGVCLPENIKYPGNLLVY